MLTWWFIGQLTADIAAGVPNFSFIVPDTCLGKEEGAKTALGVARVCLATDTPSGREVISFQILLSKVSMISICKGIRMLE
jgi:hypothetical protein